MDLNEKKIKRELIEATKAVKKKFRELHTDKLTLDEHLEQKYSPITKSLKTIIENQKNDDDHLVENKKFEDSYNDSDNDDGVENGGGAVEGDDEYFDTTDDFHTSPKLADDDENAPEVPIDWYKYSNVLLSSASDTQYGIRRKGKSLTIGRYVVKFQKDHLRIRRKSFPLTTGLLDLLFYKKPPSGYTTADLQQYKDILLLTDAHKKFFEKDMAVRKSKKNYKYTNIISPLLTKGSGIATDFMTVNPNSIDYTYWDDPNELVERLRLLVSSSSAGHTGHNNEIISIIEELKEANIIE